MNIDKARAYFKEKKPEVFPLTGHPLAKEDIYVKEIYVSILCSIAAYDGEIAESEMIFIKKVINGLELNTKFEQLVKNGLEISNQLVDDFIKAFSGKEYAFNFIADALMLAVSDGKLHDKEIELISEYPNY